MKGRYTRHKANAKRRGVPFDISYEDWAALWLRSTYYGLPGFAMCRYGDEGPYAVGNVYIGSRRVNARDRNFKYGPPSQERKRRAVAAISALRDNPLVLVPR